MTECHAPTENHSLPLLAMTIILTAANWDELWEASSQTAHQPAQEPFTEVCTMPEMLGKGTHQDIELYPGVWLEIGHSLYRDEIVIQHPEAEHPIQFGFMLSGQCIDCISGQFSPGDTMISGSGIQREMASRFLPDQLDVSVQVVMAPDRLALFFPNGIGQRSPELDFLVKGDDWQTLIYPKSNPSIQRVLQEIITCPYRGFEKRLFLQMKVHELMGLQLLSVLRDRGHVPTSTRLKASTVACIHHAREVLLADLEQPPTLLELAQQVGVSHSTLQRGFQELFGTTVLGYITQQRMIQAERSLRDGKLTVAEVASQVGYAHFGHFAEVFKQQFGITPSECRFGKKAEAG